MFTINKYIQQLITEGGDQNFLIINLKNRAYIQFAAEKGKQEIYCEVSGSNPTLNIQLSPEQIDQLTQLNWSLSDSNYHNNYSQTVRIQATKDVSDLEELIHSTAAIFHTSEDDYSYNLNLQ